MKVFLAASGSKENIEILKSHCWGRLFVRDVVQPFDGECWAFDNGAYAAFTNKTVWDGDAFMRRVERQSKYGKPEFAVCPDIVCGGKRSLGFSVLWIEQLKNGWNWYLAVQDGISPEDVVDILDKFHGVFLGGSNKYKSQVNVWAEFARKNGKKFHYARCSTRNRIHQARTAMSDSIDSAFPFWIKNRRHQFARFLEEDFKYLF